MAPPMQVAAPPKGSISVGWLWVSFLKSSSQGWLSPSTSTFIFTVQAFISSDSSSLLSLPVFFRWRTARVAMSMRFMGLVRPRALRVSRYSCQAFSSSSSSKLTESMVVVKVVWRQWSDQ